MRQVIQEILEGNFRAGNASLNFSCPRVELSLYPDSVQEGSFTIYAPEGLVSEGKVLSEDLRMQCLTPSFSGIQDEIYYRVDTRGMRVSDTIKGEFYIESNQGEYYLPYLVTIVHKPITSSLGEIRNLFHFINLAKTDWNGALKLFYGKDFVKLLTDNDAQYYILYKGLSAIPDNERNMEEFLLGTGKKKPVEYISDKSAVELENPGEENRYELNITRNGWGHTYLKIETGGGFLYTEDETVRDEDFLGNTYRLYYYVRNDKLHMGKNYGFIRLISYERTLTVPVTVLKAAQDFDRKHRQYIEKKQLTVKLMKYYQAFRLKKLGSRTWMEESGALIGRLRELDGSDVSVELFQAQLYMSQERPGEARWLLERNRDRIEAAGKESPELRCYYLYLSALCKGDDSYIDRAASEIAEAYDENRGNWRIAWLLLYMPDIRRRSPAGKWELLGELFAYKCTSPMIYMEAWSLLCMNPATLLKLEEFELQILTYAVKNDVMKEDVIMQLLYLSQRQKAYLPELTRLLAACYKKEKRADILHALCSLLIKGNKYGKKYLDYYRAGVEKNLHITRLYEYYLMSVSLEENETLPKPVLMYFAYQSDLSCEITAYLYAYVHKRKDALPEIYEKYEPEIEKFVVKQAKAGRINKDLAYLYNNVLTQSMMDGEMAGNLMDMLFMYDIVIEGEESVSPEYAIKNAIVLYPCAGKELTYPVNKYRVKLPAFDKECRLFFEDAEHNRYAGSVKFSSERLLTPDRLIDIVAPYAAGHLGYAVNICYGQRNAGVINADNLAQFKYLAGTDFLNEDSRRRIKGGLLKFYYEKDRMWELDEYLVSLKPGDIAPDVRKDAVRIMTARGMYRQAYEWVKDGMPYAVDAKTLAKLCSRLIAQEGVLCDEFMTGILHYAVKKGKYDENILGYLVKNFNGSIKDMRDIWKIADEFGMDAYALCERIVIQMLYTGAYIGEGMDIFGYYMKRGGNDEVISAFLAQSSYDYVINEKIAERALPEAILRMHRAGLKLHLVCGLACLKYYSENRDEIDEEVKDVICVFLRGLLKRQIVLPVFKKFQGFIPELDILQDKTILEYRASPGNRVSVHYMLLKEDSEGGYVREVMRDVFAGICVREFVLFFGETLQYYITEEIDGKEQVTRSGTIRKSESEGQAPSLAGSRFNMLNDIMIGKNLHDYDTVDTMLEAYYKKSFMTEKLFKLK